MIKDFINLNGLDPQHQEQHRKLFMFALGVIEKKFTTVPTTDQVPVGYIAFYESGATRRVYMNFYNTMRYINFDG